MKIQIKNLIIIKSKTVAKNSSINSSTNSSRSSAGSVKPSKSPPSKRNRLSEANKESEEIEKPASERAVRRGRKTKTAQVQDVINDEKEADEDESKKTEEEKENEEDSKETKEAEKHGRGRRATTNRKNKSTTDAEAASEPIETHEKRTTPEKPTKKVPQTESKSDTSYSLRQK